MMASLTKSPTTSFLCQTVKRSLSKPQWTYTFPTRTIATSTHEASAISAQNPPPTPYLKGTASHASIAKAFLQPQTGRKRHPPRKRGPPTPPIPESTEPRSAPQEPHSVAVDESIDSSVETLLPLLKSQPPFYITAHLHEKPYLLTQGDTVRLPFLMHGVSPGDTLRLNRASLIGSRDYTLKAGTPDQQKGEKQKWLDERLFACRATVMGVESEPMRIKEKTKRRQRHVRKIKSKHRYTILKISEVTVNDVDALKVPLVAPGPDALASMELEM